MENKSKKPHSLFLYTPRVLILILTAAAVGITLLVLPFSHPRRESTDAAVPTPISTPMAVSSSVEIVLSASPVPKAAAEVYPEGAMDLVVNGTVVCTLFSGTDADTLLARYLQYWTEQPLEKNEYLISAEITADVVLTAPAGEGILMTSDQAFDYLIKHPSLLPVIRTVRTVDVEATMLNDTASVSELLPAGVTVIRKLERPSYTLIYTEKEFKGFTLLSRTEAEGFLIGNTATGRLTETGAEPDPEAVPTPTPMPGSLSKDLPVSLSVPVKGTVKVPYGRDASGTMHYGIDYATEAGYAVYAPGDGIVIYCGPRGSLGYVIEIRHEDTDYVSRIIGMDSELNVELYQRVKKSDRLGKVAAAPGKTKPVFRYELLKDGIPIDPLPYLK